MLENLDKTVSVFNYYCKEEDGTTETEARVEINLKNVIIAALIIVGAKILINGSKN